MSIGLVTPIEELSACRASLQPADCAATIVEQQRIKMIFTMDVMRISLILAMTDGSGSERFSHFYGFTFCWAKCMATRKAARQTSTTIRKKLMNAITTKRNRSTLSNRLQWFDSHNQQRSSFADHP
ncbi:MAG TPA: hypothetical protein VH370_27280 [Humisphaera sp.]|nr:hypothetical protein [Humisphaera sp.]